VVTKPDDTREPDQSRDDDVTEWEPVSREFSLKPMTLRDEAPRDVEARQFELRDEALRGIVENRPGDHEMVESPVIPVHVADVPFDLREELFREVERREFRMKETIQQELREREIRAKALRWRRPGAPRGKS
jgi:hypothetical protein